MKFKKKAKDCRLVVRVKTSFKESVDIKELDKFQRLFLRGFLKPQRIKKGRVDYIGPVGISLYERMKSIITKRDFLFIIEQVVVAVQKIQTNELSLNYVVWNSQQVYINETTKEVQFIYLPTVNSKGDNDLISFVDSLIYSAKLDDEKDNELISRFAYFFHGLNSFDVDKIESFIQKEDRSVVNIIKKQNMAQSGYMTNKQQHYYEHYDIAEDDEATGLLEEQATALLDDDEATGLLNESEKVEVSEVKKEVYCATLYRVSTDETIYISKPAFRLGKEKSCVDYHVTDNIAVSRSHADIITRGGKYYVMDLNSKNHTYINGIEIPARVETEISNDDRLVLGNEEFIFRV